MPLNTDFNTSPYFDDYDENKNYHRVLFQPGVAVQARELTQLQTILQNQIERFGENVYKEGTIIKGCSFSFDDNYSYIKIQDLQVDGEPVNPSALSSNCLIVSSSNLTSVVVNYEDGLESQNPNLNTLYIKYINSGDGGEKTYANAEVLTVHTRDYQLKSVSIVDGGSGYSNNDRIVFTSNTGSSANARIVTTTTGEISEVILTSNGTGYLTAPTVSITNTTGGSANGSGASLSALNYIAQITTASTAFGNGSNIEYYPVGSGYAFKISDGIIFQKGHFIRVDEQTIIVDKYNTSPNNIVIGFTTTESTVNNSVDTSLLDNASGSSNYNAPGANRLKLTPTLVKLTTDEALSTNNFFSLVEFQNGRPVKQRQTTQFNAIEKEMAKRTAEESGNYVLKDFTFVSEPIVSNTTHLQIRSGPGVAYVNGYRIEQSDTFSLPIRKGTDVKEKLNTSLSTNYANYIIVNELLGYFPFNEAATISLRDTAATKLTSGLTTLTAVGTEIGTAKIRSVEYDSETPGTPAGRYRIYLFDVRMNSGKLFDSVRSIHYDGTNKGVADIVLENGIATVYESSFNNLVFPFGQKAIKSLRSLASNNDTQFTYRTASDSVSFASNGSMQISLTGSDTFPYTPGTLNEIEERDIVVVTRGSANTANLTGTVAVSDFANTVVGTSTAFLSDYKIGDYIAVDTETVYRRIVSIANNTFMNIDGPFGNVKTSKAHKRHYRENTPITIINRSARTITVDGTQTAMTISLGEAINTSLTACVYYNVKRTAAVQLTKNINKSVKVKLNIATDTVNGPWCLGIPDARAIVSVTKTTNSDYTTGATDVTSHFVLDNGQKDSHYGLSYLKKKASSTLSLTASDYLLVTLDVFTSSTTGGGIGFYSVDSYPIDDATTSLPSDKIRTQQIPVFVSPTSGKSIDLRDAVDFRPYVANTANVTSTLASTTENPSATEAFASGEKYFPASNKQFTTDLQYYLGRYDIVTLNSLGSYEIIEGVATESPFPPADTDSAMTMATVQVTPYPTLSAKQAIEAGRSDYTVQIDLNQNKRYTMKDIAALDKRIGRVEYYTALNLLEKKTKDLNIPSTANTALDRFKNGIFVDSFDNFDSSDLKHGEYTAAINEFDGELIARFAMNYLKFNSNTLTNTVKTGNLITLAYSHKEFISQPYASASRVITDNAWQFRGTVVLNPSYDNTVDVKNNPVDSTGFCKQTTDTSTLTKQKVMAYPRTLKELKSGVQRVQNLGADDKTYGEVYTVNARSLERYGYKGGPNYINVNDYSTPKDLIYYIREQAIQFKVTGLRPSTVVNVYFDKVKVSSLCRQGTLSGSDVRPTKTLGAELKTGSDGTLYGIFYLPTKTFLAGSREFKVMDVTEITNEANATTIATTVFNVYNHNNESNQVLSTVPTIVNNTKIISGKMASTGWANNLTVHPTQEI